MNSDGKRLTVLIGTEGSLSPAEIITSATGLAEVSFMLDSGEPATPTLRAIAESLAPTKVVDFGDPGLCLDVVRQIGTDAVVTFVDKLCPLAALLEAGIKDGHGSHALWGRKDAQRRALFEAGVSRVRSAPVHDAQSLRSFVAAVGFPVMVKPTDGAASRDAWVLQDERDIDGFLRLAGAGASRRLHRMFAEQFIVGEPPASPRLADYVSAEVFRTGSASQAASSEFAHGFVTDRLPPAWPCRETGLMLPSMLPPDRQRQSLAAARQALDALGATSGAFHVELKPTSPAPEIIEVNGRLGGFIARLARYGADADLGRLALSCALGESPDLDLHWTRCAVVLLFQPPAAARRIAVAPTRREAARQPGVVAVDEVSPADTDLDWRRGTNHAAAKIWLAAETHEALFARLADLITFLADGFRFVDENGRAVRDMAWAENIVSTIAR